MGKPPVVEPRDLEHAAKVARVTGAHGVRNVVLLYKLFATGLMPSEIGALTAHDYLQANGEGTASARRARRDQLQRLRAASPLGDRKVTEAVDAYPAWRIEHNIGRGTEGRYRGLDPALALVSQRRSGGGFKATTYVKDGVEREGVSALYRKLLKQAGVVGSAQSGRRTFAVLLGRQKEMMQFDPVRMADIVAKVF